ncbi:hypothetical protein PR202_gb12441 [Eleusine coracana subsp. coracana]|uniref:NB-ARC domain-containing protein n=1 Tax=Eleusine coracana subsp. coracana TaxID=191504 RepID=A0AAV5EQ16_ELECO|nr:hypothetical protein PR202_gb12441 [Eleusine coracana subsp. coracana]
MLPLKPEDSKKLFLRRVFGSTDASYPKELEQVMDDILKKCGGLPLAIVSIASVLAGHKSSGSIDKWETICKSIGSQMESSPTLEGMRQIVTLSFNHLPHELKGCMMYLSIFPEDYAINKYRLLCRWIAEGLISEKRGLTPMEVAESFLDELLVRSMIEADSLEHFTGEQFYRVHDMLLEVMVSKSLEANFVSLQGGQYDGMSYDKIRRLSIHGNINGPDSPPKGKVTRHRGAEEVNVQHLRSLSTFQLQGHKLLDELGKFTLLRVLDLEGCGGVTNMHVRYACQLRLLKFLSFNNTNITSVPPQLGNLEHLQTLYVGNTTLLDGLPETVTKLERLEHLQLYKTARWDIMWTLPQGLSKMKALHSVAVARLGNNLKVAEELGELEQLQRLCLFIGPETIGEDVLEKLALSLSKRYSLRLLKIGDLSEGKTLNFLHRLPKPPRLLRSLAINGNIEGLPSWVGSLTYLVEFTLWQTDLVGDQLFRVLCELPNLKILVVGWKQYGHNELVVCRSHSFPVLRNLVFGGILPKVLRIEKGSMENIETIELRVPYNDELEWSIEHLTNLRKATLKGNKDSPSLDLALEQMKAENDKRPKPNQFQHRRLLPEARRADNQAMEGERQRHGRDQGRQEAERGTSPRQTTTLLRLQRRRAPPPAAAFRNPPRLDEEDARGCDLAT